MICLPLPRADFITTPHLALFFKHRFWGLNSGPHWPNKASPHPTVILLTDFVFHVTNWWHNYCHQNERFRTVLQFSCVVSSKWTWICSELLSPLVCLCRNTWTLTSALSTCWRSSGSSSGVSGGELTPTPVFVGSRRHCFGMFKIVLFLCSGEFWSPYFGIQGKHFTNCAEFL